MLQKVLHERARGGIHFLRKKEVGGFAPHTIQLYLEVSQDHRSASDPSSAEDLLTFGVSTRRQAMELE